MTGDCVTQEYLLENFEYIPEGKLIRRYSTMGNGNCVGRAIGDYGSQDLGQRSRRYISTKIKGKYYKLHQLIYLYHHGYMPRYIDHINRDCLDNRIENLRESTPSENAVNRGLFSNNKSGYPGVHWDTTHLKWAAYISNNNKRTTLGYFDNKEDAILSAKDARIKYHHALTDIEKRYSL